MFHAIFSWLWTMIKSGFTSALSWLRYSFLNVWSECEQFLYTLLETLIGYLPSGLQVYFSKTWWSPMMGGINLVSYFIPIFTILGIVLTGFTLAGSIRLTRWIKSFIPTIGD